MKVLTILLTLLGAESFGDSLADKIKAQTDLLNAQSIDTIIVHRYSLFTGRYNISYDDKELQCDNEPTVAHIFWLKNKRWTCLRLDNCGLFKIVDIKPIKWEKLNVDGQTKFSKGSPHFTKYSLTIISGANETTAFISGTQLREEKGGTINSFKTINKIIKGLEDKHRFKRAV
jgi:hypothetical protein